MGEETHCVSKEAVPAVGKKACSSKKEALPGQRHCPLSLSHTYSGSVGGLIIAFKDAILAEKDRFARGLAGHLLSFALARELSPADQVAVEQIAERTASDDYKIQTLLRQIVLSKPFLTKTSSRTN